MRRSRDPTIVYLGAVGKRSRGQPDQTGDDRRTSLRRAGLRVVVGLVVLNAALAIGVLLAGDFDGTGGRILATSLALTAAALLVLACEVGRESSRLGPAPALGAGAAVGGFAIIVASIWLEPAATWVGQLAGTFVAPAVAIALQSLVSLARLASRFRLAFPAVVVLSSLLAAMIVAVIWGDWEGDWLMRLIGVVAVALAAFTILVPLFHRASRAELASAIGPRARVAFCPSCGHPRAAAHDEPTRCPRCSARYAVILLPPEPSATCRSFPVRGTRPAAPSP